MEEWTVIPEFPGYMVSDFGRVGKVSTGQHMTQEMDNRGTPTVRLSRDNMQYRRSVPVLVAQGYVDIPSGFTPEYFDTPIHLDGDKMNNLAGNLIWRPRHFAIRYKRQFKIRDHWDIGPVINEDTEELHDSCWDASRVDGLLVKSLVLAVTNRNRVWPTNHLFVQARRY